MQNRFLSEDQLTRALEKIFEKVCEINSELRPSSNELTELARSTAQNLLNNAPVTKEMIKNPEFIKKLYVTATLTLTLAKDQDLNKLSNFFNKFTPEEQQEIRNTIKFSPEKKIEMEEKFRKKFTPLEMDFMKRLTDNICKALGKNLEKNKLTKALTPKQSAKLEEEGFQNLFNLLSNKPGALPVVVQVFMGNGNAFPEFSPYQNAGNTSNINLQNRTDEPYGDYLGLNNSALINLESEGVLSALATEMTQLINTPTLTR